MNTETNYASYNQMVASVSGSLIQLEGLCEEMSLNNLKDELAAAGKKLTDRKFSVGVLGEFKRGKSAVINSLLEEEILPSDIVPATATMNRVTYGLEKRAEIIMRDGSVRTIPVDKLTDFVTKITKNSEAQAQEVEEAVVYYPCAFCKNNVDIIDTPGLNDDDRMNKITEEVIPKLDAVIMVLVHGSPFSMSEAEFVRTKLMASTLGRIIFLVNQIDTIRKESDIERAVGQIREKIRETVLVKMEDVYGSGSAEYEEMCTKLSDIKVLPFSAYNAFDGKTQNRNDLIEKSGTVEFERELTKMLTDDRGAIELSIPLNLIAKAIVEIINSAEMKKNAFSMDAEQLEQCRQETLEAINKAREDKKKEKERIRNLAVESKKSCGLISADFYDSLEKTLLSAADEFLAKIEPKKLGNKKYAEQVNNELSEKITQVSQGQMSIYSEKIIAKIREDIGSDLENSNEFFVNVHTAVDKSSSGNLKTDIVGIGVDILTDFIGIYGIGGIVAGWNAGGLKGAVVGGGIGLAANIATTALLASMSLPVLPILIISCTVGSAVAKQVGGFLFPDKQMKIQREKTYAAVKAFVDEMKKERDWEKWVNETVSSAYDEYAEMVESECEKFLNESHESINAVTEDMLRTEAERVQILAQCDEVIEKARRICSDTEPVRKKIRAILGQNAKVWEQVLI